MPAPTRTTIAPESWLPAPELQPGARPGSPNDPLQSPRQRNRRGQRRTRTIEQWMIELAVVASITAVAWALGHSARAFSGFPQGFDAWGHFSKVNLLMVNFPHVEWNDAWYSGLPYFQGSYPPLYHALIGLGAWLSGSAIPSVMVAGTAVSVIVTALSFYGFVRVLSRSRAAGLVAALLLLGSPAYWALIVNDGMYPRLVGIACLSVTLLATAAHLRTGSRWALVMTVVAIVGALSSHPIIGIPGALLVAAMLALAPASSSAAAYDRTRAFLLGTGALAAYFYVPLLLTYHGAQTFLRYPPLALQALFWPAKSTDGAGYIHALSPVLVPVSLAIAVALLALARRAGLRRSVRAPATIAALCAVMALGWLAYARIGAWHLDSVNGLTPRDTLVFIGWLLAAGCGLGLGVLIRTASRTMRSSLAASGLIAAGLSVAVTASMLPGAKHQLNDAAKPLISTFPLEARAQHDYRVAAPVDRVSEWIDALYAVPQVRGYQSQAVPNLDWQVWLEDALKDPHWPSAERLFLLDWYGVKWVYGGPGPAQLTAYAGNPQSFTRLAATSVGPEYDVYRYRLASPILTALSTKTALVIGDHSHYDAALRSIAPAGENSQRTILVEGGSFLDAYSVKQLQSFDAVFLYGASAHDSGRAAGLLAHYVGDGGGLVVDSGDNRQFVDALAKQGAPIPAAETIPYQARGNWLMTPQRTPLVRRIDFRRFSPPIYAGSRPWQVATAIRRAPWARWDLASGSGMVMASGRYGTGQAVWLGMNLPFHVSAFRNPVESRFLVSILGAVARRRQGATPRFTTHYVNGERSDVTVTSGGSGVLFKETASDGWHATVDGVRAPIYRAGPGMMYVPISSARRPVTVVFTYSASTVERLGWAVTVAAALLLVGFGLDARRRLRRRSRPTAGHFTDPEAS